ncbi:TPA: SOS response-associated peptidase family protein [Vibrio parahaemolyticus]
MCGRLNVIDDPLCNIVCENLGIRFKTTTNRDLHPAQYVATVSIQHSELKQLDIPWGIKPDWAEHIIINARAETVSVKSTFASAFESSRVVVPCSGWYEWREEQGKKMKYFFTHGGTKVLYMAGIALEEDSKLVTLTTQANEQCSEYHHRMPLLIEQDDIIKWVSGTPKEALPLLNNEYQDVLSIMP